MLTNVKPWFLGIAFGLTCLLPMNAVQAAAVMSAHRSTIPTMAMPTSEQVPRCHTITVAPGDWLSRIATRFATTWEMLYAQNRATIGPNPNHLFPGERLHDCASGEPPAPIQNSQGNGGEPCHSQTYWPSGILTTWATPPGCYAEQYVINPAHYPAVAAHFGGCDWWPQALHPSWNIWSLPKHATPRIGAVIWFSSGEQGAAKEGHWGVVVAISANGKFVLSSEMNSTIYGRFPHFIGGWGRVVFRFIATDYPRIAFVYPN